MSRTPARLPEDVTALAERDTINKDRENNKNAVTKTYHTLKDLISGKFKKDNSDIADELNNVTTMQHDDYRSPYSALPPHMRQMQGLNQSQPNIYNSKSTVDHQTHLPTQSNQRSFLPSEVSRGVQQRTLSQPQLASFERRDSQMMMSVDRRGSLDNMDVTDSDDGGFASKIIRTPQISYQIPNQKHQSLPGHNQRHSPQIFQNNGLSGLVTQQYVQTPYQQHSHMPPTSNNSPQLQPKDTILYQHQQQENEKLSNPEQYSTNLMHSRQDAQRLSFQKQMQETQQSQLNTQAATNQSKSNPPPIQAKPNRKSDVRLSVPDQPHPFPHPGSGGSSDYDKSNSNVDSGRGSAAYSSGRKAQIENSPSPMRGGAKSDDSEWVDIVDNELRNILEPGMQNLNIRPASTVSGSVSSMSPPLPPLSPDGSSYKQTKVRKIVYRKQILFFFVF